MIIKTSTFRLSKITCTYVPVYIHVQFTLCKIVICLQKKHIKLPYQLPTENKKVKKNLLKFKINVYLMF